MRSVSSPTKWPTHNKTKGFPLKKDLFAILLPHCPVDATSCSPIPLANLALSSSGPSAIKPWTQVLVLSQPRVCIHGSSLHPPWVGQFVYTKHRGGGCGSERSGCIVPARISEDWWLPIVPVCPGTAALKVSRLRLRLGMLWRGKNKFPDVRCTNSSGFLGKYCWNAMEMQDGPQSSHLPCWQSLNSPGLLLIEWEIQPLCWRAL